MRHFSGFAPRRGRHIEANPQRLIEVGQVARQGCKSFPHGVRAIMT